MTAGAPAGGTSTRVAQLGWPPAPKELSFVPAHTQNPTTPSRTSSGEKRARSGALKTAVVEKEAPGYTQELLSVSSEMPYSVFPNRFGGMLFCPQHEMIHAGQIGMLRRALGRAPIR